MKMSPKRCVIFILIAGFLTASVANDDFDPFASPIGYISIVDEVADHSLKLKATIVAKDNSKSTANINGTVYSVGDKISNYILKRIFNGKVVISGQGKEITLSVDE